MNTTWAAFCVLAFAALGTSSSAQKALLAPLLVRSLQPVQDNSLYEDPLGGLSNGGGDQLFTGMTNTGSIRRALLAFDVAGNLPAGARVVSASLTLHVTRTIAGPKDVSLHLALADWGEGTSDALLQEGSGAPAEPGDATWLHTFHPGSVWTTPGGDYASAPSASRSVGFFGPFTWSSPQMASDVQAWLDAPGTDFGWVVIGDETASATAKRFGSRDGPRVLRPTLTITFVPPRGACCLTDSTCVRVIEANCAVLGGIWQGPLTSCAGDPCPP